MENIWDTMKRSNLWTIGVEEREDVQTKGTDNLFHKIIAENFPKLEKDRVIQVQEAYRTPNHQDKKRNIPRHIIIKTLSTKKK
jgi:hypothetical protein